VVKAVVNHSITPQAKSSRDKSRARIFQTAIVELVVKAVVKRKSVKS
jgi:hypothetical protein